MNHWKKTIIKKIESLYSADDDDKDIKNMGLLLLERAKILEGFINYHTNWRDYPENILWKYLIECVLKKNEMINEARKFIIIYKN